MLAVGVPEKPLHPPISAECRAQCTANTVTLCQSVSTVWRGVCGCTHTVVECFPHFALRFT